MLKVFKGIIAGILLLFLATLPTIAAEITNADIVDENYYASSAFYFSGNCAYLDADNDTAICADTDDQIDFEIGGADDFQMTANTFSILSGSSITDSVASWTNAILSGFSSITATTFTGALTGNADTATALATARTIGGTSFDGTANIAIGALNSTNVGATTSSELAGVLSDESGSGVVAFTTSPQFTAPTITTGGTINLSAAGSLGIATNAGANTITIGGATSTVDIPGALSAGGFTLDGDVGSGDINLYDPVNDGNPVFNIGSTSANRGTFTANYDTGAQTLKNFTFSTTSATTGNIIFSPAGNMGIGTTSPTQKLQINGNMRLVGSLGSETLSETDFATHANWATAGDFDDTAGNATYTHSTAAGTLTQASAGFATAAVASKRYEFAYTVSSALGTKAATVTTAFADQAYSLDLSNGSHTTLIKSAGSPGDFVISATSSAASVGTAAFSGSGLDDLTAGGTYSGAAELTYVAKIDGVETGVIASTADYSGTVAGTILATDEAHGLSTSDSVVISGTTDYNGTFTITVVDVDTFYFTDTWVDDQSGAWELDPNTFKWSDDGGSTWDVEDVAITGAAQTLNNGVTVTFGATTGHTADDEWTIEALPDGSFTLDDFSLKQAMGGDVMIESGGLLTGGGATGLAVDSSGNVGIGTTEPGQKLGVNGYIKVGTTGGSQIISNYNSEILIGNDVGGYYIATGAGTGSTLPILIGDNNSYTRFKVDGSEVMRLDNGNVGIGTTAPSELLHLKEGATNDVLTVRLQGGGTSDASGYLIFDPAIDFVALGQITGDANSGIGVAAGGNVGIGTTAPGTELHIEGNTTYVTAKVKNLKSTSAAWAQLQLLNDVNKGFEFGAVTSAGYTSGSAGNIYDANYITVTGDDFTLGTTEAYPIRFFTGGSLIANERMVITSTGNVGIGTTSPATKLDISGAVKLSQLATFGVGTGATCTATTEGTIQYNVDQQAMNFCNGTEWKQFAVAGCPSTVQDSEGNSYKTVQVGDQCWMNENLNVGTKIDDPGAAAITAACTGNTGSYQTIGGLTCWCQSDTYAACAGSGVGGTTEKYCYSNTESYCDSDGALYEWAEAMDLAADCGHTDCSAQITTPHQGICPSGWHIPTDEEYKNLEEQLGMSEAQQDTTGWRGTTEGDKLKTYDKCFGGTDCGVSGWNAVLAGYRHLAGGFSSRGSHTYEWSSSQNSATNAWKRYLNSGYATVNRDASYKADGFSLRCLQD